jgi:hypothetical protein
VVQGNTPETGSEPTMADDTTPAYAMVQDGNWRTTSST